jgi:protein subunit release factor A
METVIIEIRAAEGGDDAKLLVVDQLRAYTNVASRRGL